MCPTSSQMEGFKQQQFRSMHEMRFATNGHSTSLTPMTFIKPKSNEHRISMLSMMAVNVARRMGIKMKPYDAEAVTDGSGVAHWTCVFDEHESRIYRTQNGIQRMADVDVDQDKLLDLDVVETGIRSAIEKLMLESK